ncbi:hypothetical protein [Mesorhizobium sp. M0408]|uniref:hypothetical protein n=1 Tax=Mesorhizobium sp. M0408 TaxID=2956942 RepID=UPI00333D8CE8
MQGTDHFNWMLSAALGTLARAKRMHKRFLKLLPREGLTAATRKVESGASA